MRKNFIVGNLEIFYRDNPKKTISIPKGAALSSALKGGDWRIPTFEELSYLYELHKLGVLNLEETTYWSSHKDPTGDMYKCLNFRTGESRYRNMHTHFRVRPVRSI